MTRLLNAATIFMLTIGESTLMADSETPIKVLDTIHGASFLAIRTAVTVLQPRKLDLAKYQIVVVHDVSAAARDKGSFVVVFVEKKKEAEAAKNFAVRLAPEVELSDGDANLFVSKLDQLKVLDRIQGGNYPPIVTAAAVFQPHKPDWQEYKIDVVRDGESVVVIFLDKNRKPGTRGAGGVRPGFEVEMRPDDLKVLRSNFVK